MFHLIKMVKYCVSSRYSGPTCYDVSPGERKILKTLTTALCITVLIVFIILLINYVLEVNNNTMLIKTGFITSLILFAILIIYQLYATTDKPILCRGYTDCSKI